MGGMKTRRALYSIPGLAMLLAGSAATAADRYDGPRPEKQDLLYLMHADNLIPTESVDARQEGKKDEPTYTIPGANSTARTPLAEPIFLLRSDLVDPERLELYKLDVKNGHREVTVAKRRRGGTKALHLTVTKLDGRLYRVEVDEPLDDGQYAISSSDSETHAFCFEVY
jgi:hypothetical protein